MAVRFYEQHVISKLKNKRKLSSFLQLLIRQKKQGIETVDLIYIFCNDDYLLEINKEYLNHDTFTDIISFDMSETPKALLGEIYVSIDRIRENAKKFKETYEHELHRVIFHGALHLCGFKDKAKNDKERMRQEENICLSNYFKES